MNMIKKKYYLLSFLIIILLSACTSKNGLKEYEKCLDILNNDMNYTISEIIDGKSITYEFSNGMVHVYDKYSDTYYYTDDYKHYSLTYQKENNVYIKEEIDSIKPYELIGRFNSIYDYVEKNNFEFKDNEYESLELNGTYNYDFKTHTPLKIEMALSDNKLYYFYEYYTIDNKKYTDVIYITDYGKTIIELPQINTD